MRHGHVTPNPDGSKSRCGGPKACSVCAAELADKMNEGGTGAYNWLLENAPSPGDRIPKTLLVKAYTDGFEAGLKKNERKTV